MQKLIVSLVVVMFLGLSLQAQEKTQTPQQAPVTQPAQNAPAQPAAVPDNPNAPEIVFEKTVHDYGTLVQGGDGTCEFKFTNTGKEPLILSKPQSSCGCTVPTWPQEPILPGKSDVIKVTYATHNIGPINKTVTVNSNAKNGRVVLSIKGNVIAKPAENVPEKTNDKSATPTTPINK